MRSVSIRVTGKVQGVWFRDSTRKKALELGVHGFVQNEADGSVYCEAEGEGGAIQKFVEWCRSGPPKAKVEAMDTLEKEPVHCAGFEIRR